MSSNCRELKGSRPQPLKITKDSWKVKKPKQSSMASSEGLRRPVVIYHVHTPKVIHTKPQDFMSLVQHLTGKRSFPSSPAACDTSLESKWPEEEEEEMREVNWIGDMHQDVGNIGEREDPLLLTLGHSPMDSVQPPVSPGFFQFSPRTHQFLQEFAS